MEDPVLGVLGTLAPGVTGCPEPLQVQMLLEAQGRFQPGPEARSSASIAVETGEFKEQDPWRLGSHPLDSSGLQGPVCCGQILVLLQRFLRDRPPAAPSDRLLMEPRTGTAAVRRTTAPGEDPRQGSAPPQGSELRPVLVLHSRVQSLVLGESASMCSPSDDLNFYKELMVKSHDVSVSVSRLAVPPPGGTGVSTTRGRGFSLGHAP